MYLVPRSQLVPFVLPNAFFLLHLKLGIHTKQKLIAQLLVYFVSNLVRSERKVFVKVNWCDWKAAVCSSYWIILFKILKEKGKCRCCSTLFLIHCFGQLCISLRRSQPQPSQTTMLMDNKSCWVSPNLLPRLRRAHDGETVLENTSLTSVRS